MEIIFVSADEKKCRFCRKQVEQDRIFGANKIIYPHIFYSSRHDLFIKFLTAACFPIHLTKYFFLHIVQQQHNKRIKYTL